MSRLRSARALLAGSSRPNRRPSHLPPLSYVCPMAGDEDVIEDKPGVCRKCGMELKPTRPRLGVDLRDAAAARGRVEAREVSGGRHTAHAGDGGGVVDLQRPAVDRTARAGHVSERRARWSSAYAARAHGNHNPQHGGQFFMAPDNWHHVEGAYLRPACSGSTSTTTSPSRCRSSQVRAVTARDRDEADVRHGDEDDQGTRPPRRSSATAVFCEARIGKLALPAQMTAKVSFKKGGSEHVFDFAFEGFSKEPPARTIRRLPPGATHRSPSRVRRSLAEARQHQRRAKAVERLRSRQPWRTR